MTCRTAWGCLTQSSTSCSTTRFGAKFRDFLPRMGASTTSRRSAKSCDNKSRSKGPKHLVSLDVPYRYCTGYFEPEILDPESANPRHRGLQTVVVGCHLTICLCTGTSPDLDGCTICYRYVVRYEYLCPVGFHYVKGGKSSSSGHKSSSSSGHKSSKK